MHDCGNIYTHLHTCTCLVVSCAPSAWSKLCHKPQRHYSYEHPHRCLPLLIHPPAGKLGDVKALWKPQAALTVVMAAKGYPGEYAKGVVIRGLDSVTGAKVRLWCVMEVHVQVCVDQLSEVRACMHACADCGFA